LGGRLSASESPSAGRRALQIAIVLAVVAALFFLGKRAGAAVPRFAEWVQGLGVWGPVVFILGYAVATVAFVPGLLLTLAAGAIFGLWRGTVYVMVGATLGAALAFLVARYAARRAIERRMAGNERFAAIDRAVAREGRKIVFLLRLSPVFPFNLLNYALGLTRVRFADYLVASIGMLPATLLYVYAGKLVGDVAALAGGAAPIERDWKYWTLVGAGLAATVAVTAYVTRLARRALKEAVDPIEA
jgi:uncharacterized membrane protein YdjX (TVP38/TMEM64 family)